MTVLSNYFHQISVLRRDGPQSTDEPEAIAKSISGFAPSKQSRPLSSTGSPARSSRTDNNSSLVYLGEFVLAIVTGFDSMKISRYTRSFNYGIFVDSYLFMGCIQMLMGSSRFLFNREKRLEHF